MKIIPAIFIVAFAAVLTNVVVYGFDPPNVPVWPGTTSSPTTDKVAVTGEQTWEAVDSYGFNGWEALVAEALDTGSADPDSLGNTYNRFLASENRGKLNIRKARSGETPDIRHTAASTAFVEAKCGTGGYTACVYLLSPITVPAYYKAALMLTYGRTSQKATIRHEDNHALTRSCDEYRGGCPRASDGVWEATVVCTGNPDTLMDCGGAAVTATAFDYNTMKLAYPTTAVFLQVQAPCNPCYDGTYWTSPDWSEKYRPNSGCGEWWEYDGRLHWGECTVWPNGEKARWNDEERKWVGASGSAVDPKTGRWYVLVPPPLP